MFNVFSKCIGTAIFYKDDVAGWDFFSFTYDPACSEADVNWLLNRVKVSEIKTYEMLFSEDEIDDIIISLNNMEK